jgi:hypothetical protein
MVSAFILSAVDATDASHNSLRGALYLGLAIIGLIVVAIWWLRR